MLLNEHRLGNYRTNAAGTGDSSNGRDEMDEKDDEIPHLRMLAKLENARNWAHFSNSPPTVPYRSNVSTSSESFSSATDVVPLGMGIFVLGEN